MPTYDFDTQLAIGEAHERRLDTLFQRYFAITPATRQQQRQGIDRNFVNLDTGATYRVEYKADALAGKTGNAFIETVSVDATGRPGWAVASQADILIYLVVEPEAVYAIRMATLRMALHGWMRRYPRHAAQNAGYKTLGYLVPLNELERIAMEVH